MQECVLCEGLSELSCLGTGAFGLAEMDKRSNSQKEIDAFLCINRMCLIWPAVQVVLFKGVWWKHAVKKEQQHILFQIENWIENGFKSEMFNFAFFVVFCQGLNITDLCN